MKYDIIPASPDIDPTKVELRLKVTFGLSAMEEGGSVWSGNPERKAEIRDMLKGVLDAPEFRLDYNNYPDEMLVTVRTMRDVTMMPVAASDLIIHQTWYVEIHTPGAEPVSYRHRTDGPAQTSKRLNGGGQAARERLTFYLWDEEVSAREHAKLVENGKAFSPILFGEWHELPAVLK